MNKDPNNPFNWRMRTEPSIFAKDVHFRPKQAAASEDGREKKLLEYKQFGIYSRATPNGRKPNKHEVGK